MWDTCPFKKSLLGLIEEQNSIKKIFLKFIFNLLSKLYYCFTFHFLDLLDVVSFITMMFLSLNSSSIWRFRLLSIWLLSTEIAIGTSSPLASFLQVSLTMPPASCCKISLETRLLATSKATANKNFEGWDNIIWFSLGSGPCRMLLQIGHSRFWSSTQSGTVWCWILDTQTRQRAKAAPLGTSLEYQFRKIRWN